jgi:glycerol-1-phosphate dehydrogenase [NAD(P)+]
VRSSLQKITDVSKDIKDRDLNAVQSISEGLVLSGIAMAFANMSRPASGLEHYFSHCWDMMALVRGEESDLHGIQVGIGTLLTMKLFKQLAAIRPTMDRVLSAIDSFDEAVWEANIHRVFGNAADYLIAMDSKARKNEAEARIARARRIIDNWDQIVHIINQELPEYQVIENLMEQSGMPVKPQDIGFSVDDTVDAFVYSRDTRDKYLTSSLIWDLGYMDEFARWLRTSLATEKERSCNNN